MRIKKEINKKFTVCNDYTGAYAVSEWSGPDIANFIISFIRLNVRFDFCEQKITKIIIPSLLNRLWNMAFISIFLSWLLRIFIKPYSLFSTFAHLRICGFVIIN